MKYRNDYSRANIDNISRNREVELHINNFTPQIVWHYKITTFLCYVQELFSFVTLFF